MREILFRGKRVDNNEWIYGYYHKLDKQDLLDKTYIIPDYASAIYSYEVIPETIGQYTGLKDNNGIKIFEGDILRDYGNEIEEWTVSFEDGGFIGTFDNVCEHLYEISDLEVIGNIHDKEV